MNSKGRVLVAMSGGIDSTVTALLLHEAGYEVVGVTMKTWDYAQSGSSTSTKKETGCCSLDSINDARALAVQEGFPHFILDIREEFGDYVIDNFVEEYLAGRTPNPCILCNTHIKWEALLKRAEMLDCAFIATGHYAIKAKHNDRYYVKKARDNFKDQSYVLWGLSQECLSRTIFPIGHMTKSEVRQIAADRGYTELSKKGESYEICFVPDNDYRGFLKRRVKGLEEKVADGLFVDKEGIVLGKHQGYPFYTIGQRRGLGIATGEPIYVTHIDPANNTVTLGPASDLLKTEMKVGKTNLLKYAEWPQEVEVLAKVRYQDKGTPARLKVLSDGTLYVTFYGDVRGIAPGQSAVFYEGDDVIGGGIISREEIGTLNPAKS